MGASDNESCADPARTWPRPVLVDTHSDRDDRGSSQPDRERLSLRIVAELTN